MCPTLSTKTNAHVKTVLIICPFFSPNIGGVETHLDNLVTSLIKRGYTVYVQTYKPLNTYVKSYLKKEKKENFTIYRHWLFGTGLYERLGFFQPLQSLYTVPLLFMHSLIFLLKQNKKIDIINSHGLNGSIVAYLANLFFKKKTIATVHYNYTIKPGTVKSKLIKIIYNSFDHILTVGKESKKDLENAGINSKKIIPFYQWFDNSTYQKISKTQSKKKAGLKNKFVILFVGRIIRMKGVFELCEAAKQLDKNQYHFLITGDGEHLNELKQKYSKESNLSFVGKKNKNQLAELYGTCDCVILPSQSEEGSPMVVLESLFMGRPIILTDKGDAKNMVDTSVSLVINPTIENIKNSITDMENSIHNYPPEKCIDFANKNFGENKANEYIAYFT